MSKKVYKNVAELIGNTPLMEVTGLEKEYQLEATVLVKIGVSESHRKRKGQSCKKYDCRC